MTTVAPSLGLHVQAFFGDYLTAQRALSQHTVLSYRDTFKLFLGFAARRRRKSVADLGFADVGPDAVLAFLEDLERSRKNSVRTRNVRLAALHTFFRYVAGHEPQVLDLCQRVSAIPVKKTHSAPAVYLEHDEVLHILSTIDRSTRGGRRDYLLVRLLFETGARAQEIAGLRTTALRLSKPCQVHLSGKGGRSAFAHFESGPPRSSASISSNTPSPRHKTLPSSSVSAATRSLVTASSASSSATLGEPPRQCRASEPSASALTRSATPRRSTCCARATRCPSSEAGWAT